MAISGVQLSDQKDHIIWKWTNHGQYTIASAYECQFLGAIAYFPATMVWKAASEPKCKFFAWLALHDRVLTPNNMIKRNWQCNYNCSLCLCIHETTEHLLTQCNFTKAAWNTIAQQYGLLSYDQMPHSAGPCQWATKMIGIRSAKDKKRKLGILFTF
jgi:hypothetical protein